VAEQVVYHVVRSEHGEWSIVEEGSGQTVSRHRSKIEAILQGQNLARSQEYSLLVVHDRDGHIDRQYTYGRLPRQGPPGRSSG
jgi:hypothetical protein